MKNSWKVIFVIIGTMIGAGFASGQEVNLFFFSYGLEGMLGLVISCVLMGYVIYKTLILLDNYHIETYKDFLDILMPKKSKHSYFSIKTIINWIINLFIVVTFFIMIAGFGAYFEQEFGINSLIGSSLLAIISFIILMTSVKGVVKANEILVPFLIGSVTIIGILNLLDLHVSELGNYVIKANQGNFIWSAILYSSYNSILLIPVLLTLKRYLTGKKQIIGIASITTIIMVVLSIMIFLLLVRVDVNINYLEMPAVYVVSNMFKILRYIYGFIILGSIFTTAISLGTSFLQNVTKTKKSYIQVGIIICFIAVLVSKVGFANLVSSLYPVFGYLGLLQILKIAWPKHQKKKRI